MQDLRIALLYQTFESWIINNFFFSFYATNTVTVYFFLCAQRGVRTL